MENETNNEMSTIGTIFVLACTAYAGWETAKFAKKTLSLVAGKFRKDSTEDNA